MKNILVTGGAGFIGSHLVRLLVNKYPEYHIINMDVLTYAGNLKNLKDIESKKNYSFVKCDICDFEKVKQIFKKHKIDSVIHLAAESHVDRSIIDPFSFAQTNVMGTLSLLQAAKEYWDTDFKNKLFYHVSTDEVYGSLGEEGFFTEESAYDPHSPYSASKASSDHFVRAFSDTYGLPIVISNCSNNYGSYQFPEKLIPLFINNIVNNKPLPVYGKGDNVRDWLFVNDHTRAMDVIFHKGTLGDTYNIGGLNEWKNIDLIKLLISTVDRLLGREEGSSSKLITYVDDRAGHDLRYAIDSTKLKDELGWEPSLQFEQGIEKTVAWYLDNKEWIEKYNFWRLSKNNIKKCMDTKTKYKILVTGGLGYIGSHVVVELQNNGFEVVIIDDLSNSSLGVLDRIIGITGIKPEFEKIDLKEKKSVIDFFNRHDDIDGVIHFAASKAVGESVDNPLKYYENNIHSLVYLLQEINKLASQKLIFSSSCTVYGQSDELPITEQAQIKEPESPYGNTKKIGEQIIKDTCSVNSSLNTIALRYFNPIGAHKSANIGELPIGTPQNLVPFVTQTGIGIREKLSIFGNDYPTPDGTCIRDYIHVVDLAKAHAIAMKRLLEEKNTENYEVYNIGTGKGSSVLEVVNTFKEVTGVKLNFTFAERRAGDIISAYADTTKANTVLGWKSELTLKDALLSAWEWEKKIRS